MKTKFTKVAVSERVPKDFSKILINYKGSDNLQMYDYFDNLHEQDFFEENINFWLEESPDREEEMIEMLEELVELKRIKDLDGKTPDYLQRQPKAWEKAKSLLQSLKHP